MAAGTGLSARVAANWRRLDAPRRLPGIDLARGLAVVGMLAAHLVTIETFEPGVPATWLDVVNGRSSILFATLAGVSIALTTGGVTPIAGRERTAARWRLAVRALALWVLGILLVSTGVPVYVILPAYAILFALAIPLLGLRAPALFAAAAALAIVMPFVQPLLNALPFWDTADGEAAAVLLGWAYPFPIWIVFLLAGMGLGRLSVRAVSVAAGTLAVGTALAMLGYGLAALASRDEVVTVSPADPPYLEQVWTAGAHTGGILEVVGSGGFALAVIGACVLLCRSPLRHVLFPLRAVGSMPLTAYTAQILVWALWAWVALGQTGYLDAFRALEPFWPITLGILLGCTAWALTIGRGPLEGLLARVSALAGRD